MKKIQLFSLVLALAMLGGCAIVPEQIKVADDKNLTGYEAVIATPEQALNKSARWGGAIVSVENKKNHSEIELVHFALNGFGRPISSGESVGRFKVKIKGFVDPLIYEQGRLMTFVGSIGPVTTGIIGEQNYQYPTLVANNYYLWKQPADVEVTSVYFSSHWGGWNGFGYHGWSNSRFHNRGYIRTSRQRSEPFGRSNTSRSKSSKPVYRDSGPRPRTRIESRPSLNRQNQSIK